MKKSKIEARLRAILDGRTRRGVTRTEKAAAMTLALAVLVPLAFVRAAAVAPFAALPETSDPTVTVHVASKPQVHRKLTKKQLAALKAHHLRALAAKEKAAAEERLVAKIEDRVRAKVMADLSGLSDDQAKQATETGQLKAQLKNYRSGVDGSKALDDSLAKVKFLDYRLDPKPLKYQLDAKALSDSLSVAKVLDYRVDPKAVLDSVRELKALNPRIDVGPDTPGKARALKFSVGFKKDLFVKDANEHVYQVDTKAINDSIAIVKELNYRVDSKEVADALAKVKVWDYRVDPSVRVLKANQDNPRQRQGEDREREAVAQKKEALRRAMEADQANQDPSAKAKLEDEKAALQALEAKQAAMDAQKKGMLLQREGMLRKLEAERAAMDAQKKGMLPQREGMLRKMEAERAAMKAQRASMTVRREGMLRKLEAERATMNRVKREMRDVERERANRTVRNSNGRRAVRPTPAQRKAQLERERAALQARLKAIEAELSKQGK